MFDEAKYKIWKHLNKKMEYLAATGENTFLSKRQYKIWKHLSKQLDKKDEELEKQVQEMLTFGIQGVLLKEIRSIKVSSAVSSYTPPCIYSSPVIEKDEEKPVASNYKQIVSVNGFYFSGSSAALAFFKEFDNTTVVGEIFSRYTKHQVSNYSSEMNLFREPGFFGFIDAFSSGTLLEKDLAIKRFISLINRCFNNKCASGYDYNPQFYTRAFFNNSVEFITNVLDLDDDTLTIMKNKTYPVVYDTKDDAFKNCSFFHNKGVGQYILYRFKEMSPDAFNNYAKDYIRSLFRLQSSREFYCFDAMAPYNILSRLNSFMDKPIKRIAVRRDPRDQFVSAFRKDIAVMPRDIEGYANFYENGTGIKILLENPDPDTLLIRFEDLVLKYDETTKKMMDFIGMDAFRHINPKSIFDPSLSVTNIGAYRYFEDQEFIRQIEERLSKYCYYPEKENLSDEAWNLLKANNFAA
ncbi:MAG: sulfotransferase domain-containing protein [Alphaproteobacteria bacterium]|nr:sulfotransferase domain-containing protein [Alphaproteobacteria bacterium]